MKIFLITILTCLLIVGRGSSQEAPKPAPAKAPAQLDAGALKDIEEGYEAMEVLTRGMELIRQNYVDEKKIDYDRLVTSALNGVLRDLDPHSQYIAPQVFEQIRQSDEDSSEGVGIIVSPKNDSLVIVTVREDGPAARAGLMPGDTLIKIADTGVEKLGYIEAVRLLRGKPGESLKLTIYRSSTKDTRQFEMVHEVLRQDSVRDAMLLPASMTDGKKIGYVRLLQFNGPSAKELSDALDTLEEKGLQALILDLRNNPGGLLISAVDICGQFLPAGTTVVTTEGRNAELVSPPLKTKDRRRPPRSYPLAILINHASASASELTAGALQDLKRAMIVGETSFGKGSVQTIIPGDRGTAIRLTTAKYFTPSHKTIHEKGIEPNIVVTLTPDEEQRIFRWRLTHPQASAEPASMAKLGDRQLERGVTALRAALAVIIKEKTRSK